MATGVDAKLLKSTKFPPEFNQKVDMQKVNIQVMKKQVPPIAVKSTCSYHRDAQVTRTLGEDNYNAIANTPRF